MNEFFYEKLSYKINGLLYDVYNALGYGYKEKTYQEAFEVALKDIGLKFSREERQPIQYRGIKVGTLIMDFVVDDKIVVELKVGDYFPKRNIEQIHEYLVGHHMNLGILANFTKDGVRIKRIVNSISVNQSDLSGRAGSGFAG